MLASVYMVFRRSIIILFILLTVCLVPRLVPVQASSNTAYQDFVYQFDLYRNIYNEFSIAKNEYEKYQSLSSKQSAIDKTREMLTQRAETLRVYILLLIERLGEDQGLSSSAKLHYNELLAEELQFLINHKENTKTPQTIESAEQISATLESHDTSLQTTIRQVIVGISIGQLNSVYEEYRQNLSNLRTVVETYADRLTPSRLSIAGSWIEQIENNGSAFQESIQLIQTSSDTLSETNTRTLNEAYRTMQKQLADAKILLVLGTSYMKELVILLQYKE